MFLRQESTWSDGITSNVCLKLPSGRFPVDVKLKTLTNYFIKLCVYYSVVRLSEKKM